MILPIAVYYDYIGGRQFIRFLKFGDDTYKDYNIASRYIVTPACMDNVSLVDIPTTHPQLHKSSFSPISAEAISIIDANGTLIKDYTQAIVPINTRISRKSLAYLVDYKGNVLKTGLGTIEKLVSDGKIQLGNPKDICQLYVDENTSQPLLQSPDMEYYNYPLVDGHYNIHHKSLLNLYTLQGKPSPSGAGFTTEHISLGCPIIIVPEGSGSLVLNDQSTAYNFIHSVICPSIMAAVFYILPETCLKVFKSPKIVYYALKLRCKVLQQFISPEIALNEIRLVVGQYTEEKLALGKTEHYTLEIDDAPNLKDITIQKEESRTEAIEINVQNAPNLRQITIDVGYNSIGLNAIDYMPLSRGIADIAICVASPKYTIILPEPVYLFRLAIPPHITNCEITIKHRGIQIFQYLNTSDTNKIIFSDDSYSLYGNKAAVSEITLVPYVRNYCSVDVADLCDIL